MISDFKSVPDWLDWFEFELELESRVSDFRFQDRSDWLDWFEFELSSSREYVISDFKIVQIG